MKIMTALFCLLIIVILVIFFPKVAGVEGRPGVQPSTQIWFEEECSCFGYKYTHSLGFDTSKESLCFGLPYSCKCFKNTFTEIGELISEEVSCNKLNYIIS
ncbi:MAG TPA: hypothetical protein VJG49_01580 [Candidatus Nanoarchaeia archaeon]|nr:hypothetical protein [Candidatus Nanoarchaeia archaeon]